MALHDLQALYSHYPEIIAQILSDEFSSHEFILRLAQQHQVDYVEALHSYRSGEPFRQVHAILSAQLQRHPDLVTQIEDAVGSPNIFGEPQTCARWRKVA